MEGRSRKKDDYACSVLTMEYYDFLKRVIDDGIEAATRDYTEANGQNKLEGSITGFESCRDKSPEELREVYFKACEYVKQSYMEHEGVDRYWWFRTYQSEVEWVCNVVSAILHNDNKPPILPWLPTVNGVMKASLIIGVQPTS